ncbi:hypothetical protein [Stratiformator vulcanicus]|uniref:HTH HARE-type domain-containing protein n=1 Tax=Stratiformator vulcanicus TaxID=2527980 RepID=A0A517R5N6_9PLAN|nr:hypothetical protein [Stratiformator vulcanicus]QDT39207.1 hypothetical protein Pan189_36100 [Stratiformator vulcanicus]
MAKSKDMTVAELEELLEDRRSAVTDLEEKRAKLLEELSAVDQEIADLAGGKKKSPGRPKKSKAATSTPKKKKSVKKKKSSGGRRARNTKSLKDYILDILAKNKKGLDLNEMMDAVQKEGYKSKSADFKTVLYQTLYHLKRGGEIDRNDKTGAYVLK